MLVDDDHPYDCARLHENENCLCLNIAKEIEVNAFGIKMAITKDNYEHFFEAVKDKNVKDGGKRSLPNWLIISQANICPRFMFGDEFYSAFQYYNLCDGLNASNPEELDNHLGLWVDVCSILNNSYNKWMPIKQKQIQELKSNA